MGNNWSPVVGTTINNRLQTYIIAHLFGSTQVAFEQRGPVILAEIQIPEFIDERSNINLFHVLMVHPRGIEMFCLFSGMPRVFKYAPDKNRRIIVATSCRASPDGDFLLIGEDNGCFKALDMENLSVQAVIEPQLESQRNRVTCIISPAPDLIYAGYQDGSIKVWHTASQEPQFEFNSDSLLPGVRSLAYSHKSRLLFSGHESSFEDPQGRAVKLEVNPIRVYVPHAGEYETKTLNEFKGTCFGLVVLDDCDIVVALSSEENRLYMWDFITETLVLTFQIPAIKQTPIIATQLAGVSRDNYGTLLLIGFSDGCALASHVSFNQAQQVYEWKPVKLINPVVTDESYSQPKLINNINYNPQLDILMLGNSGAALTLVNNFYMECSQTLSEQQPEAQVENRHHESFEVDYKPKKKTAFEIFYSEVKPRILEEMPEADTKHIILRATEMFNELPEEEKQALENSEANQLIAEQFCESLQNFVYFIYISLNIKVKHGQSNIHDRHFRLNRPHNQYFLPVQQQTLSLNITPQITIIQQYAFAKKVIYSENQLLHI